MDDNQKISFLNPATIMFFVAGFLSDLSFLGAIAIAIPGIGLAIVAFILGAHYFIGIFLLFYLWGKTRGFLPKAVLILAWILPLPLLTIGIVLAIIASNKLAALILEQVVIQAVAIGTAGAGEALEAGAVAAEGVEVAATAAEAAEAGMTAAEAGEAGVQAAEVGAQGAEAGAAEAGAEAGEAGAEETADLMASEAEANPMENLEADLTKAPENFEFPEEAEAKAKSEEQRLEEEAAEKKAKKRIEKVFDISDRRSSRPPQNKADDQDDDYAEAA